MSEAPVESHVEIFRQPDGMWRWRWVEHEGATTHELISYMAFEGLSEARESAEESYPGLPVQVPEVTEEKRAARKRRHRGRLLLLLLTLAAFAVERRRRGHRHA